MKKPKLNCVVIPSACLAALVALTGCNDSTSPENMPAVQHLVAAREALARGDKVAAMQSLDASIDADPTAWAYLDRAQLHMDLDDIAAAKEDCRAGLQLAPDSEDFLWLKGELQKNKSQRFKDANAPPPSASK